MKLTPKIQKAINKAAFLHLGQTRKSSDTPYIVHPFSVACILSEYTDSEDVICAGLLHDVLEDVKGYLFVDLESEFGSRVAKIVREVSEDKDPGDSRDKAIRTWQKRKEAYIANLKNDSEEALMVSCADKIHNLNSLIEVIKEQGGAVWKNFNAPDPKPDNTLWYYKEIFNVLKSRLKNDIVKEMETALNKLKLIILA